MRDKVDHARTVRDRGGLDEATLALRISADTAMSSGPWSVADKTFVPEGASRNEYVHIAEYAWPVDQDPGSPWVIRDGRVNAATRQIAADGHLLARMGDAVWTLTLAARMDDDERYATRARVLLHAWFVEPATAMHPSLRHAVHVPGHSEPMPWGLARLHPLWQVLDAVELLDVAGADDGTVAVVRSWCGEFLEWLLASELYRAELDRANNHATHAIALALGLAMVVDDTRTTSLAEQAATLLDAQVEPDGSQPAELVRSRSYYYCGYNLAAMLRVAELAWCCGVDLLGPDGALRRALDAMLPSLVDPRRWPMQSVEPSDRGRHGDLLVRAVGTWPGHSRIVNALQESRITPGRGDRVWIEAGVDPAVALDRRR